MNDVKTYLPVVFEVISSYCTSQRKFSTGTESVSNTIDPKVQKVPDMNWRKGRVSITVAIRLDNNREMYRFISLIFCHSVITVNTHWKYFCKHVNCLFYAFIKVIIHY